MQHHIINTETGGLFYLSDFKHPNYQSLLSSSSLYKVLLNTGDPLSLLIDDSSRTIHTGELLFCKPLNTIQVGDAHNELKVVAFNKDFYALKSREEEVAFYWFWYYAVNHPRSFGLMECEKDFFGMMYDWMEKQFNQTNGCIENLRDALKRIMSVSIAKINSVGNVAVMPDDQLHTIKKFSLLIEEHFREKVPFTDIPKLFRKKESYLQRVFDQYLSKRMPNKVKKKVLEKSHEAMQRIETGIELQYNSRLNPMVSSED